MVERTTGIALQRQRLMLDGQELLRGTLYDSGITANTIIHLVVSDVTVMLPPPKVVVISASASSCRTDARRRFFAPHPKTGQHFALAA